MTGALLMASVAYGQANGGDVVSAAQESLAPVAPKALGDTGADLVYTPVTPCRIINTLSAGGPIAASTTRSFRVTGSGFTSQGGVAGSCGVPVGATGAVINFVAVNPAGAGDLRYTPFGTPVPLASFLNYVNSGIANDNTANGMTFPICNPATTTCTNDFTIQADASAVDVVADVQGYFRSVTGSQNGLIWAGAHITGIGVTPTVTRFFSKLPGAPTPTVIRLSTGVFEVNFGSNISTRFYQLVPGNPATGTPSIGFCDVTPRFSDVNALFIRCFDAAGVAIDNNFFVQVY
jgi:hypothetical protein